MDRSLDLVKLLESSYCYVGHHVLVEHMMMMLIVGGYVQVHSERVNFK